MAAAARKDARGARGFIFGCSTTIPSTIYDIAAGTPVPRDSRPESFLSILARGRSSGLRFRRIERTTSASFGWTVNQEISMLKHDLVIRIVKEGTAHGASRVQLDA